MPSPPILSIAYLYGISRDKLKMQQLIVMTTTYRSFYVVFVRKRRAGFKNPLLTSWLIRLQPLMINI